MEKILLITYYWPPSGGAGVQRWLKMVKYLAGSKHQPIVLTVREEDASYPVRDKGFLSEVPKDVKVIRTRSLEPLSIFSKIAGKQSVPHGGFSNVDTISVGSKLSRWIRGNFFIPDARRGWNRYALKAAIEIIKAESVDLVITTGPPHSTHLIGRELQRKFEIKWIADFRDPWTDIYYYDKFLHSTIVKRYDKNLELDVLKQADLILSVCPSNQKLLRNKLPTALREKVKLLTNGYDADDFKSEIIVSQRDWFQIAYTGTIAEVYNPAAIFEILKDLPFEWKLVIAGSIAPAVRKQMEVSGIEKHIEFLGYLTHSDSINLLRTSDLLLHIMPETDQVRMGSTGKLFEYIGSGVPILNIAVKESDAAYFISVTGSGLTFSRAEKESIIYFIDKIRMKLWRRKNSYQTLLFSREKIVDHLKSILDEISA